jgi:hypothetical protein
MTAVYTLWARLPDVEGAWMIAAEDEWCWEGDPDRCKSEFDQARAKAEAEGSVVREVWFYIDQDQVEAAFRPAEITPNGIEVRK